MPLEQHKKTGKNRPGGDAWYFSIAIIAPLVFAYALVAKNSEVMREQAGLLFQNEVELLASKIKDRMYLFAEVQRGGVGLFAASKSVERDEWTAFVSSIQAYKSNQEIKGMGYIAKILNRDRENFEKKIRKGGVEDYRIWPPRISESYFPIVFVEPKIGNDRELGRDFSVEEKLRQGLIQAKDSGRIVLTEPTVDSEGRTVLYLFSPVYRSGVVPSKLLKRLDDFVGWVYVSFFFEEVMRSIWESTGNTLNAYMSIQVYSKGGESTVLYKNSERPTWNWTLSKMEIAGTTIILRASPTQAFLDKFATQNNLYVWFGATAFIMLSLLSRVLLRSDVEDFDIDHLASEIHRKNRLPTPISVEREERRPVHQKETEEKKSFAKIESKSDKLDNQRRVKEPLQPSDIIHTERHYPETLGSIRVLIVEDNLVNQKVTSLIVSKMGMEPLVAENGQMALGILAQSEIDFVFMDLQMPVMDGFVAVKEITERYGSNRPWVCALTASDTAEDRRKCNELGMQDYIMKPISQQRISDAIGKYMKFIEKQVG